MMRLSSIVLILALTCLPVHGQDQVKHLRGDKEIDSKGTQAETPQGETADPVAVPTKEVEPPQVPMHHADAEAEGEWVWVPYTMEGPDGEWDDADMGEEDAARSFVAWHRGRGWGRGGRWGRGWGRGGRWGRGWGRGGRWGHRGWGGRGWGRFLREDKEIDSKGTPQGETADPVAVPTKEVEPPQVPKHQAPEDAGKVDGPAPQFGPEDGEWVWVPYAAMEGPPQAWEGDFDDADDMGEAMTEADTDDMPEDARSFVAWHRGRGWGRGGRWGRGWGRGGRWGRGWGRGGRWGHRGWGRRGWGRF